MSINNSYLSSELQVECMYVEEFIEWKQEAGILVAQYAEELRLSVIYLGNKEWTQASQLERSLPLLLHATAATHRHPIKHWTK